ncbi:response regulator [Fibrella aquatica]|uniref:response regulator n=1 Tax=Fibrella aquatica TaxID=3242487 RepID=UPI0035201243
MNRRPIILIEDDEDDQFLLHRLLKELDVQNNIRYFANGQQALDYLTVTDEQPFIILCDMNMPVMSGLELRLRIDEDDALRKKAIPFIFLTTDASQQLVKGAYEATIQGFFKKEGGYSEAKEQLRWIIGYWSHCIHPNNQGWS